MGGGHDGARHPEMWRPVLTDFRREAEGVSGDGDTGKADGWLRCGPVTSFPRLEIPWILTSWPFLWRCIFL